jgi:hypothetical protein
VLLQLERRLGLHQKPRPHIRARLDGREPALPRRPPLADGLAMVRCLVKVVLEDCRKGQDFGTMARPLSRRPRTTLARHQMRCNRLIGALEAGRLPLPRSVAHLRVLGRPAGREPPGSEGSPGSPFARYDPPLRAPRARAPPHGRRPARYGSARVHHTFSKVQRKRASPRSTAPEVVAVDGAPGRSRTCDPRIRSSPSLCPTTHTFSCISIV